MSKLDVAARLVTKWPTKPGEFMFTKRKGKVGIFGMIFCCPCGCGESGSIAFKGSGKNRPEWNWNGKQDKPTLTPSLNKQDDCKWHGFLTDGVFKSV